MTRAELFPNIAFGSMSAMRIVASSVTVTETNRLVDRAGFGLQSRIYGLPTGQYANVLSRAAILNATYKDETNFSEAGNDSYLRSIYAPGDFSDLHMKVQGLAHPSEMDVETLPVIQGYVSGYGGPTGASPVTLTFEFNVVIEYVPDPTLYQMVERKPAVVNPGMLAKAENAVGQIRNRVSPMMIEQFKALADTPAHALETSI